MSFKNYKKKLEKLEKSVEIMSNEFQGGASQFDHITKNALSNLYAMLRLSMKDSFVKGANNLFKYVNVLKSNNCLKQEEQNHPGIFGNKIGLNDSLAYLKYFSNYFKFK
jgi:hypothetical protein